MNEDCPYLFAYGTLRDRNVHHKAHFLHEHAIRIGAAHVLGRLYKVTWYPALILGSDVSERVTGDIYELPLASREMILHEIDGYEGIYGSNEDSDEYERVLTRAVREDGSTIECWVYNYKRPLPDEQQIVSGDYRTYLLDGR